ncbi:MAG: hypothetical protein K8F91_24170, partial [Candidatus Obscuribacterales bacterium]|nr:hypothetical protein [Candidatus Obscuribacterales bacterium]
MYCKRSLTVLTSVLLLSACTSTGQDSEKNRIEDKGSKSEVTLDSIGFNTEGWKKLDSTNARVDWQIDNSQILSKEYFAVPPEIPHNLDKLKEIREMYRAAVTSSGGGLVSVDVIKIHTLPVIKTIFKFPQKPSGMAYVGSLTLPLENFSFVIKVQAKEAGATGMRDA